MPSVLCCLGDLVEDVVVRLAGDVAVGTDTDVTIVRRRGGSAANVAVTAAAITESVRFIGRVGADRAGTGLVEELSSAGVEPLVQRAGRTGTIVVLVDTAGERSMLRDRAAAAELDAIPSGGLDGVTWLHVPAYSLVGGLVADVARDAIGIVSRSGGSVSIDASSVAVIEEAGVAAFRGMLIDLAPQVVFCNREEAQLVFGDDVSGMPADMVVIIKDGAGPATSWRGDRMAASVPARDLGPVSDTTGAGDAFAAGYAVAAMGGATVAEAMRAGHGAAARHLRGLGGD